MTFGLNCRHLSWPCNANYLFDYQLYSFLFYTLNSFFIMCNLKIKYHVKHYCNHARRIAGNRK